MPLISIDIRVLRSFVSVVKTGSVTETARQLGRTQPAISFQIQKLEELTNKTLFRHEGRRQTLTDDGDLVLSYAKSILRLHDELLARLASPDIEGHVVLGTPDLYAAFVLPAILNRFRKAFPRVQETGPRSVAGIFVPILTEARMLDPDSRLGCPGNGFTWRVPPTHYLEQIEEWHRKHSLWVE